MDDLRQLSVFAETVSAGSMSGAARRLGMTPSAVSQTIKALEKRAGVALLHRSTRKLALTEAGQRCLPYCLRLHEAGSAAMASLEQARDAPDGELRVAAPIGFAAHVSPALAPVLADWPKLRLRLVLDDRMIDLIDARIDLALRVGELADSNWVGRRLCDFEPVLCAAPSYLERHGIPAAPAELGGHHWLAMAGVEASRLAPGRPELDEDGMVFELSGVAGARERVRGPVRIATTSQVAVQQLCEHGMGLAILFHPDVRPAVERGLLVRLLPHWQLPSWPVTLVTRSRDTEPAKVRVAVDALRRYFATLGPAAHGPTAG